MDTQRVVVQWQLISNIVAQGPPTDQWLADRAAKSFVAQHEPAAQRSRVWNLGYDFMIH